MAGINFNCVGDGDVFHKSFVGWKCCLCGDYSAGIFIVGSSKWYAEVI